MSIPFKMRKPSEKACKREQEPDLEEALRLLVELPEAGKERRRLAWDQMLFRLPEHKPRKCEERTAGRIATS